MAEVPEIPTDIQNKTQDIPDNVIDKIDIIEIPVLPDIEEVPKPKRGRPKGAANKGPSKPRAKKAVAVAVAVAPVEAVYEPSSPKRNLNIPYDGTDELASRMLKLLAGQAQDRQRKKRELYASWMN